MKLSGCVVHRHVRRGRVQLSTVYNSVCLLTQDVMIAMMQRNAVMSVSATLSAQVWQG